MFVGFTCAQSPVIPYRIKIGIGTPISCICSLYHRMAGRTARNGSRPKIFRLIFPSRPKIG
jgi:hypothetical protein